MEFLNPAALLGLFALPLLLIPYLVRRKPRRMVFSSLLLFLEAGANSSRPLGRLRLPPIFFLQLLLLALLILALSEPVFSVRPTSIAIVLDNSASMQALEDGKTRMAAAAEKAAGIATELGPAGKIDLYTTTPRLQRIGAAPFGTLEAGAAIRSVQANDLGDPPVDYSEALGRLLREGQYQRVYLVTDHPAGAQSAALRVISVGAPKANLALTAFTVRRSSLGSARLEASATVRNFSAKDEKIKITIRSDGAALAGRDVLARADQSVEVNLEGLPERAAYQAEIDARDALALDNRRFAAAPASRNLRILAVTPQPQAPASLRSVPGVSIDVIAPADYPKTDRSGYSLEIFQFAAPESLPDNPALFILPPGKNFLAQPGAPIGNPQVSNWRESSTLTRYINFSLFRPAYARPLKPQTASEVIIESPAGPLAFSFERNGLRYLALGFDPLPYLGRENLPMSIFTLNFLDWFSESGAAKSQATGEPIALGAVRAGDQIVTPAGEQTALKIGADYFFDTYRQGIYRRQRGSEIDLYARNLADSAESDLRTRPPIDLQDSSQSQAGGSTLFSFWPYLLLGSLLLFLIEWFINPRPVARGLRRRQTV
jgi:hypothetical protein